MIRRVIASIFILLISLTCSQVHAEHIQYVSLADVENLSINYSVTDPTSWSWTFDLVDDDMYLWQIGTNYQLGGTTPDVSTTDLIGSYNPLYDLHYVYLRIDPNHFTGESTSSFVQLKVNGTIITDWSNPILLYDWGVPGGSVSDPYNIAELDYTVTVTLTGLETLESNSINIDNVNIEGCFENASPVPEPATIILLGSGLAGLAGFRRKFKKA